MIPRGYFLSYAGLDQSWPIGYSWGMNVLIACERSGVVREAFRKRGHNAWSCDLVPADDGSPYHIKGDAVCFSGFRCWDLMIAHPPCTYILHSGCRWLYKGGRKENGRDPERWRLMAQGAAFFKSLWDANIPKVCAENPVMVGYAQGLIGCGPPTQIVQPWQFGHGEQKKTCFWLKGLPPLKPTNIVAGRAQRLWRLGPGQNRGILRSITYQGIADAMADQWG